MKPQWPKAAGIPSKTCSLPSLPSRPSACFAPMRLTPRGCHFNWSWPFECSTCQRLSSPRDPARVLAALNQWGTVFAAFQPARARAVAHVCWTPTCAPPAGGCRLGRAAFFYEQSERPARLEKSSVEQSTFTGCPKDRSKPRA